MSAKARLAKQGLTIPRLELISAQMVTNSSLNVKVVLEVMPVTGLNGWLDSTVALFWSDGSGQYKQFVKSRVQEKIRVQPEITWRHVPTQQNPADLASRGGDVEFQELFGMAQSGCQIINDGQSNKLFRRVEEVERK